MGADVVKHLPLRIVYVTTPDGKARLLPHLQPGNVGKATQAPVNAILAVDSAFHHQIPRLFPFRFPFRAGMQDALEADPGLRDKIGTGAAVIYRELSTSVDHATWPTGIPFQSPCRLWAAEIWSCPRREHPRTSGYGQQRIPWARCRPDAGWRRCELRRCRR